jgi:hypothetical protein
MPMLKELSTKALADCPIGALTAIRPAEQFGKLGTVRRVTLAE